MKFLLIGAITSICIPFAAFSAVVIPAIGEKASYSGVSRLQDGDYLVTKTYEVVAHHSAQMATTLKVVFSQFGDGVPLGSVESIEIRNDHYYEGLATDLAPLFLGHCPTRTIEQNGILVFASPETIESRMGPIATCRIATPIKNGLQHIAWWSTETAPWPVQILDSNQNDGTFMRLTLDSLVHPAPNTGPSLAPRQTLEPGQPAPLPAVPNGPSLLLMIENL